MRFGVKETVEGCGLNSFDSGQVPVAALLNMVRSLHAEKGFWEYLE
jgi:hypothetical protein